ncbi:signal peptidase I [Micrococcoides hystricis]|uniref:Signal peptidase I n=1 Tax=Micrococcoides hystricis TaxID=1572761 RepID=A0ABV6PC48_9MICC
MNLSITPERKSAIWRSVREFLIIIVIALVASFIIKTFFFRAFYIPSGSMENTLQIKDRIFVNLMRPGIWDIDRGDIVVFTDSDGWLKDTAYDTSDTEPNALENVLIFVGLQPDPAEQHLIKRVIGMPGDRVECCDDSGRIKVNGQPIDEPYVHAGVAPSDFEFDVTVPEDSLWVMGDNRNRSADSRYHMDGELEGFVPIDTVTGRAELRVWPFDAFGDAGNAREPFENVPEPAGATHSK